MTLRSLASRYKSISRPSPSAGGSSSYAQSLVKKQQTAEDSIIDNQYADGLLTPEGYLVQLQQRAARASTPNQTVSINEKIKTVQEQAMDSEVDRRYQAGEYTTATVLQYEKDKLAKMTATDSTAYNKQSQKIQTLQDKSERESRTSYRLNELNRISQMPDYNAESLIQKANVMERLAAQAAQDGDTNQATSFSTQKNIFLSKANQASVNEQINQARLENSGGMQDTSNPTAQGGAALFGGKISISSPQIKRALESVDAEQKRYNNLVQSKAEKENMLARLNAVVGQAEGEQKTSILTQINNLKDSLANTSSDISASYQNIQDKVQKVYETQASASNSSFVKSARMKDKQVANLDKTLEIALQKGELEKDEYLLAKTGYAGTEFEAALRRDLAGDPDKLDIMLQGTTNYKVNTKNQLADFYEQNGKDSEALSVRTQLAELEQQADNWATKLQFQDNLELVYNDEKRQIEPSDMTMEKANGGLYTNYVRDGNILKRVIPTIDPETGLNMGQGSVIDPTTGLTNKENKTQRVAYLDEEGNIKSFNLYDQKLQQYVKQGLIPPQSSEAKQVGESLVNYDIGDKNSPEDFASIDRFQQNNPGLQVNSTPRGSNPAGLSFNLPKPTDNPIYDKNGRIRDGLTPGLVPTSTKKENGFLQNIQNFFGKLGFQQPQPSNILNQILPKFPTAYAAEFNKTSDYKPPVIETKKTQNLADIGKQIGGLSPAQQNNVGLMVKYLNEEGILDENTLAYALATAKAESNLSPKNEIAAAKQAAKYGYEGGATYAGRGLIQLTGTTNYRKIGDALGLDLVNNPDLANDPEIAARILAKYFKMFGTAKVASTGDFYNARKTVNGLDRAKEIADSAKQFKKLSGAMINTFRGVGTQDSGSGNDFVSKLINQVVKPVNAASAPTKLDLNQPGLSQNSEKPSRMAPTYQPSIDRQESNSDAGGNYSTNIGPVANPSQYAAMLQNQNNSQPGLRTISNPGNLNTNRINFNPPAPTFNINNAISSGGLKAYTPPKPTPAPKAQAPKQGVASTISNFVNGAVNKIKSLKFW